jgi:hypothetical protein
VASIYRSIAHALKNNPFMAAIVTRDEGTFGKYLRRPGNIFEGKQPQSMSTSLLQALQEAGTIRHGVNISTITHIMDVLANDLVSPSKVASAPPYYELLATIAEMFDRMLTPENGGNAEAGKRVLRQFAAEATAFFEEIDILEKDHSLQ